MNPKQDCDLVIVGLGALGAMAAREAARRGIDVIGVDLHGAGHDNGASGGMTRIFRMAYKEGSAYRPLLRESLAHWSELQAVTEAVLWQQTGALTIGRPEHPDLRRVVDNARHASLDIEQLTPSQAEQRWPQHRYLPDDTVIFDPDGGLLRPDVAIATALADATRHGARLLLDRAVTQVDRSGAGSQVMLSDGAEIWARRVLYATGPWSTALLPELRDVVELRRVILHWYPTDDPDAFSPDAFPVGIRRGGESRNFSFFPQIDPLGVKVNFHTVREVIPTMHTPLSSVDDGYSSRVSTAIPQVLRGVGAAPARAAVYVDGYTPDFRPILGAVPGQDGRWVLTGGSGQAFKMSPALARVALDVIEGRPDAANNLPVASVRDAAWAGARS